MTKANTLTKALLRRVADVARERNVRITIRPDGTMLIDHKTPDLDTTSPSDDKWRDIST